MGSRRELVKTTADRKGRKAIGASIATVGIAGGLVLIGAPIVGILAGVAGGTYSAAKLYEWLRYRGEYGLRF